jgi:membrane protein
LIPIHLSEVRPWWARVRPTAHYLMETEAHVYALAVAASTLLAFFPFLLVMVALCRDVLHWPDAVKAIDLALQDFFAGEAGGFLVRNLNEYWTTAPRRIGPLSIFLLLFTANGIFEPLEVALNRAWGVTVNRSYLKNQLVSLGLIFACGGLALLSLMLTALNSAWASQWHSGSLTWINLLIFKIAALPVSIFALFLVYWLLPNRKIDPARVMPVALWVGLILEALKYCNLLLAGFLEKKFDQEYYIFKHSVTIVLWSFVAALIVLAGAHWTARRDKADPLS